MNEEIEFRVGDIVSAFGLRGVVSDASEPRIFVQYTDGNTEFFNKDGKLEAWHKEPSLKLVERPKKLVKKTMWQAVIMHEGGHGSYVRSDVFESKEEALEEEFSIGTIAVEVELVE